MGLRFMSKAGKMMVPPVARTTAPKAVQAVKKVVKRAAKK